MSATDTALKTTTGNQPIPQHYNPTLNSGVGDYEATQGEDGGVYFVAKGDKIGLAKDGTDQTGVTPPTGATGIRGWLSAIYNLLFGGTAKVQATVTGRNVTQALDETNLSGGTLTLTAAPVAVRILNTDTANDGVFTVNGIALKVPAGTSLETGVAGVPSTSVSVTGSTKFIFHRLV